MLVYGLFILGFVLLVKGAGWLVEGASSAARRMGVSDLAIGLTVVAFGTSAPELFVNVSASLKGIPDIALGNIIGSNIANILLILGVSSIIFPLAVDTDTVWKGIPLCLLAAVLCGVLANDSLIEGLPRSELSRIDGLVLLSFFIVFLYYSYGTAKKLGGMNEHVPSSRHSAAYSIGLIILGIAGLTAGGKWVVEGAVRLAAVLGASRSLLGLTVVAVGTSLPELATSAVAAYRKNPDIAVGNVVGSNIFNTFLILGISSSISPLHLEERANINIGMMILASFLLFLSMFTGGRKRIDRWEGVVFVVLYIGYIVFLVARG